MLGILELVIGKDRWNNLEQKMRMIVEQALLVYHTLETNWTAVPVDAQTIKMDSLVSMDSKAVSMETSTTTMMAVSMDTKTPTKRMVSMDTKTPAKMAVPMETPRSVQEKTTE